MVSGDEHDEMKEPEWIVKKREYEERKNRTKLALNICTICGKKDARRCKGCGTTAYCSTDCQRIDWRDRDHRNVCKKIQAAGAAQDEAPTPPPSPPVFYGPAPRSHADEVRERIAAEHEAARERREANPEPKPQSARWGSRCPICLEDWDVNAPKMLRSCCCRTICKSCENKIASEAKCPLCRSTPAMTSAEELARLRRHVENEVPEAILNLGDAYRDGDLGLVRSTKKACKLYKRAVELGNSDAMLNLGYRYLRGDGVKLDKKKAKQLWLMAAERGLAAAQWNMAIDLIEGDPKEAIRYYRLAAEQGFTQAEVVLGLAHLRGDGVEFDLDEGKRLLVRAASKGDDQATSVLADLANIPGKDYLPTANQE